MADIKLKKMEDFVIIDYKVITGNTILYEGFDRVEAQKHYDNFVRQNIGVKYIYRHRPAVTFFQNKDIHIFQSEILKAVPQEIRELLIIRAAGTEAPDFDIKMNTVAGMYPSYFEVNRAAGTMTEAERKDYDAMKKDLKAIEKIQGKIADTQAQIKILEKKK